MNFIKKMKIIISNLEKSKTVTSLSKIEASALAHSFLDIEESCNVFIKELLPKLRLPNISEEEVDQILFSIGEEFRHILYHINDPNFYEYLKES